MNSEARWSKYYGNIPKHKLQAQPPQLRSGFKQKQIDRREKKRKQRKEQNSNEQEQ